MESEPTDRTRLAGGDVRLAKGNVQRPGGEVLPWIALVPRGADGRAVLWVDGAGKSHLLKNGRPTAPIQKLLDEGRTVVSIDLFGTGEFPDDSLAARRTARTENYPGFLFCYNRPLLAERVGDVAAAVAKLAANEAVTSVQLVGTGGAGPSVLLARAITPPNVVARTIVDLEGASLEAVTDPTDPLLLPAALKCGGLGGFTPLALPSELIVFGIDPEHSEGFQAHHELFGKTEGIDLDVARLDHEAILGFLGD